MQYHLYIFQLFIIEEHASRQLLYTGFKIIKIPTIIHDPGTVACFSNNENQVYQNMNVLWNYIYIY